MRKSIRNMARHLVQCGLNQGSAGNVSVRDGDGMIITPSGIDTGSLRAKQMVAVGSDGRWSGPWKPSSEWRFHHDIYARRPDIRAIIHCHSPHATALAVLGRGIPAFHYMVAMAGGVDIRCTPYALFGTQELSDLVVTGLDGRQACLMGHHGMIACGADLDRAFALAVEVEHLAGIYLSLLPMGEPPRLDDRQMTEVLEKFKGYGANAQKPENALVK